MTKTQNQQQQQENENDCFKAKDKQKYKHNRYLLSNDWQKIGDAHGTGVRGAWFKSWKRPSHHE